MPGLACKARKRPVYRAYLGRQFDPERASVRWLELAVEFGLRKPLWDRNYGAWLFSYVACQFIALADTNFQP